MQGSVLSPIKCSVSIDFLGKECLEKNENIYKYKNLVNLPPLSMCDDILGFAVCGQNSNRNEKAVFRRGKVSSNTCRQK